MGEPRKPLLAVVGSFLLGTALSFALAADKAPAPVAPEALLPRLEVRADSAPVIPKRRVVVEFDRIVEGDGRKLARFRFVNRADKPARFSGYSDDYPRVIIERTSSTGWERDHPNWCGTGAGWHSLAPGQSITINAVSIAEDKRAVRVGVIAADGQADLGMDEAAGVFWSAEVKKW